MNNIKWLLIFAGALLFALPAQAVQNQNAANQRYTNNTDGFTLGGGTTARSLSVISGDITLTGTGSGYIYSYPGATTTLVGVDTSQTLTNKTWNSNTIGVPYGGTGATTLTGLLIGNGTSAVTATAGTQNYAVRWATSGTIGIGALYDDATNVGIGTTAPAARLTVAGGMKVSGDATLGGNIIISGPSTFGGLMTVSGGMTITGGATFNSGNVGIGTASPATKLQVNGAFAQTVVTLTDAASVATNAALGNHFRLTTTQNFTLANPTNPTDGQKVTWEIIQDGTGGHTIALGGKFAFGSDITAIALSAGASKRDFLGAIYNATTDLWYVVSFVKGY